MLDKFTWAIVGALIVFVLSTIYHYKDYDVAKAISETNPDSMKWVKLDTYTSSSIFHPSIWRFENKEAICYIYQGSGISCFKKGGE
jgi:hypothetical protein